MGCGGSKLEVPQPAPRSDLILGKYELVKGKAGALGEGSFSIVHKAKNVHTGAEVAVKYYKKAKVGGRNATLTRFNRQVSVLLRLTEPLVEPKDEPHLWDERMKNEESTRFFMELFDYTKNASALDLAEETLYLATEMADFSLKDLISDYRETNKKFTCGQIQSVAKGLLMVGAALHSKKMVHLDIKPENFMRYGKDWKLIDVDGCVELNSRVAINDSSISFSPCYCAPEWAEFLVQDYPTIKITDKLDVWSIAMSLCELVTLDAIFKSQYAVIFRRVGDHRKAGFGFLEWLADGDSWMERIPTNLSLEGPDTVERDFRDLLWSLLKTDSRERSTMAQLLSHKFVDAPDIDMGVDVLTMKKRRERAREPASQKPAVLKGCLHKLNSDSDPKDPDNWLKRDMWLSHNGSLCYFSPKYQKRLVYIESNVLMCAEVNRIRDCAMEHAFSLKLSNSDEGEYETVYLACETAQDLDVWMEKLEKCSHFGYNDVQTLRFSAGLVADFRKFQLQVRNRRENVGEEEVAFQPTHQDDLYKLNQDGDPLQEDCWTLRTMWIAKNGSLCYESKKETKKLQYFTAQDMERVTFTALAADKACHKFAFQLQLPPADGLEYAPAYFAATSQEALDAWTKLFQKENILS